MKESIEVKCLNNGVTDMFPVGTTLKELADKLNVNLKYSILGALVNNSLKHMDYVLYKPKTVQFIDYSTPYGRRMYIRSLSFVLYKAVKSLYPKAKLHIENSVANGVYFTIRSGLSNEFTYETVANIKSHMNKIILDDIVFRKEEVETSNVIKFFRDNDLEEKIPLFETSGAPYSQIYYLGETMDYFYGSLVPSTGYLKVFDLKKYHDGLLLLMPQNSNPDIPDEEIKQEKLFNIFREFKEWGEFLGISNIGGLNQALKSGKSSEIIKLSEAMHEKRIANIANKITERSDKVRVVLVSGPSSSGKTTFSMRLSIQLKVNMKNPRLISLDNYFVDREKTPLDAHGEYDFESLRALDIYQLNKDLSKLLSGEEVELPKYSFVTGKRYYDGEKMRLEENDILVMEGIHALNPELTKELSDDCLYKVYVSALASISIDGHNNIPTSDVRLLRRIIRDLKFRNYTAKETISRWESVRNGEVKHIYPFQEYADDMFNSFQLYELSVLKNYAEDALKAIKMSEIEYAEASRLLTFLSYFNSIPENEIPPTSIMKEFLGDSSFEY